MKGYKLTIEACGLTRAQAVKQALTICGMILTSPEARGGWTCGGTDGNATGRMEKIPDEEDAPATTTLESLIREVMAWHADPESVWRNNCDLKRCDWCERAAKALGGK